MSEIMFPPGRMVGGNVDELRARTESDGKTAKMGRDGKPEMQCSIGLAIPKGAEKAWWETAWGAEIYKVGAAAHPTLVASPAFSWKITDGDSRIPNKKGKLPCDQTGYPGHWVLWLSQGWLPKCCNADGTVQLPVGAIVPGYYVQVYGSVAGNKLVPNGTPGVYLNPIAVALIGEGDKIASDVDTTSVGFGNAAMPQGARPVTAAAPQFAPGTPVMPGAGPAAPPLPPAAPAMPAAPAAPVMLPAAQGQTYAAMIAAGWTDATLVQHGMMQAPAAAPPLPPAAPVMPAAPPLGPPPTAPAMNILTPGAPPVPPTPPAPTAPVMLAAAQGVTYEAFKAQNWTDEQLRAQGYMQ